MATEHLIVGCGALIFCTKTKRYLFLLRNKGKFDNTWGLVGGKIEQGESVLIGLQREIQEELGGQIIGAKTIPIEKFTSSNEKFVYHTFLITVEDEFVPELNIEHKGFCWVNIDNLPKPWHPGLNRLITSDFIKQKMKLLEKTKD